MRVASERGDGGNLDRHVRVACEDLEENRKVVGPAELAQKLDHGDAVGRNRVWVASLVDRDLDGRGIAHPGGQADQHDAGRLMCRDPDPRERPGQRCGRPRELPAFEPFLHSRQETHDRVRSVRGGQQSGTRPEVAVGTLRGQRSCRSLEHGDADQGKALHLGRAQELDDSIAVLPQLSLERPPDQVRDMGITEILVVPD